MKGNTIVRSIAKGGMKCKFCDIMHSIIVMFKNAIWYVINAK